MKIVIMGGTGLIGSALSEGFLRNGHNVWVVSRTPSKVKGEAIGIFDLNEVSEDIDVVINLAGAGIADKRWSSARKALIRDSRMAITENVVNWLRSCKNAPKVLISASAIGFYGIASSDNTISEDANGDQSFSSALCREWEAKALAAKGTVGRIVLLRTGIVLSKEGGALKRMLLPFKLGLGGKIGSGRQWMPWVDIKDIVNIVLYLVEHEDIEGAVNATAPNPVRNEEFTQILGKVVNRSTFFPIPSFVVRLLWGEMGEELLLSGRRVIPQKLLDKGFTFQFPHLVDSLNKELS